MPIHNASCWTTHILLSMAGAVPFSLAFAPVHQIPSRSEWNNVRRPMFGSRCRVSFGERRMSSTNQDECFHVIYDLEKDTSSSTGGGIPWLDDDDDLLFGIDDDDGSSSIGKSIGMGKSILCLPEIASQDECRHLFTAAFQAAQSQSTPATRGRSRFSVSDPNIFDGSIVFTGEEILLRVLDYLDDHVPSIYQWLFDPVEESWAERQPLNAALEQPNTPPEIHLGETCTCLRDLYMQGALEWSEGEPAINIYQGGGYFGAHKDHLALTVLIPLTSADKFEGSVRSSLPALHCCCNYHVLTTTQLFSLTVYVVIGVAQAFGSVIVRSMKNQMVNQTWC